MTKTMEKLASEALTLSAQDRAELAERMVESLVERPDPEIERAWAKEARRRLEELRSGKNQAIPGEEVNARVRRLLAR